MAISKSILDRARQSIRDFTFDPIEFLAYTGQSFPEKLKRVPTTDPTLNLLGVFSRVVGLASDSTSNRIGTGFGATTLSQKGLEASTLSPQKILAAPSEASRTLGSSLFLTKKKLLGD